MTVSVISIAGYSPTPLLSLSLIQIHVHTSANKKWTSNICYESLKKMHLFTIKNARRIEHFHTTFFSSFADHLGLTRPWIL